MDKTVSFARQDFILKSRHYLIGLIIQNSKYKNSSTAEGGGREKKSENYTKPRKAGGGGCRRERREGAGVPGKPRDDVSSQTECGRGQHRPAASLLVNTLSADIRRCSSLAQQLQLSRERPPPRAQPGGRLTRRHTPAAPLPQGLLRRLAEVICCLLEAL